MMWLFLLALPAFAGRFQWVELSPGELELRESGKTFFVYRHGAGRDCCYLHPVNSPAGVTVTDDGPVDHKHHRGVFWGWPQVEQSGVKGDSWLRKGAEHRFERIVEKKILAEEARLKVEHTWLLEGKPIAKETVTIQAFPRHQMNVSIEIEALHAPVRIAGAPEQNKGYGGFSARFAPRTETRLRSNMGPVEKDEDHVPHSWAELEGQYKNGRAVLRIQSLPGNPNYPNEWCLRNYGFVGANFPGVNSYTLQPGKPVTLRYTLSVADVKP
ncbi:MAG: DUF6807 family protein [Bryobacteraceae bacterium]